MTGMFHEDPYLDLPEDEVVCRCEWCFCDMFAGELGFDADGDIVCEDCFDEFQRKQRKRVSFILKRG